MNLRYGLLSEGDSDLKTLSIVIQRLGERLGHTLVLSAEHSNPVSGPISKAGVRLRTIAFVSASLDLGFYLADNDKGDINKLQMIRTNVEAANNGWINRAVIGIPDPHMEAWLLADQDTVKNFLGISSSDRLPSADKQSKPRINALVSSYGDDQLTVSEFRTIIASTMDIDVVLHNTEFAAFESSLRTVINFISNQT